jgi:hypothetical protein
MRDASAHHWQRWRVTLTAPIPVPTLDRSVRMRLAASTSTDTQPEEPGVDGIRHELVARIRREIAAGTYDNEEKWLAAEAELLRRIEERI